MTRLLEREQVTEKFLRGWTPKSIFEEWRREVTALGINPQHVVQDLWIGFAPWSGEEVQSSDGMPLVEWWPKAEVQTRRQALQDYMNGIKDPSRGFPAYLVSYVGTKGPRHTIEHLIEAGDDVEKVAAVLIAASLFPRMKASRRTYPREEWPLWEASSKLGDLVTQTMPCHWGHTCTSTLPEHEREDGIVIKEMSAFIRFFAVEHAKVLHQWTPVVIGFNDP